MLSYIDDVMCGKQKYYRYILKIVERMLFNIFYKITYLAFACSYIYQKTNVHLYIGIAYLIITWIHIYLCLYLLPKALLIWFSVVPSVLLIFNGVVSISGQDQQIVSIMLALICFFSLIIYRIIQLTTEKQIRNHEQLDQLHTQEMIQSSYSTSKKFTVAFILKDFIMSMHSISDKQYLFTKLMFNLKLIQKSVLEQSVVIWKSSLEEQTICAIMMIDMYNIKYKSPELKQQLKTFCMNIVRQKQQVQQIQYKQEKIYEQPILWSPSQL
ncbi:Hypothetical_protein [Hexamita inflata]|uniref:Hypothetical_protein n=1 Tax=Hexamita inflata TaxID=28002 RepID=A0ABP1JGF5_9EUKA